MRANCLVTNICRSQPPKTYGKQPSSFFMFDGPDIQEGLALLRSDFAQFSPNCVLLLGDLALKAAGVHHSLDAFRGSIFLGFNDKYKCVSSFHPTSLFQNYDNMPLFLHDLNRAVAQAKFPELRLVICADDDRETPGNPGVTHATAAARAVGGFLAVPKFPEVHP